MSNLSLKFVRANQITTYTFEIDDYTIYVIFKDGLFDTVKIPFSEPYTRKQWKILSLIEKQLPEIGDEYEKLIGKERKI